MREKKREGKAKGEEEGKAKGEEEGRAHALNCSYSFLHRSVCQFHARAGAHDAGSANSFAVAPRRQGRPCPSPACSVAVVVRVRMRDMRA